ncbi:MAG: hypothetical protein R8J94_23240 [Acidimicrobiia bacterium]|nr:hypothetical protein [Acidimicrobiia bacterium]
MSTISVNLPTHAANETSAATRQDPFTMRDAQIRMIPLSALVVFALVAVASYLTSGEVGEAVGIGAFMSFWIGGGFGAIMGGALWNHHNEASLYKS